MVPRRAQPDHICYVEIGHVEGERKNFSPLVGEDGGRGEERREADPGRHHRRPTSTKASLETSTSGPLYSDEMLIFTGQLKSLSACSKLVLTTNFSSRRQSSHEHPLPSFGSLLLLKNSTLSYLKTQATAALMPRHCTPSSGFR